MKDKYPHLLITVVGMLLLIPFIGSVHLFDWDEINFAESAREMLVTGNFTQVQINYQPFWEKPPLFFWLQSACMSIWGVNEFAARLPNAVVGIITFNVLFYIGRREEDSSFAWYWVLSFAGSLTPFFYFKSGIIDPWFNLFIFSGVYFLYRALKGKLYHYALSGILIGLAVLTKGPVGLLLSSLTFVVMVVWKKAWSEFAKPGVYLFGLVVLAVSSFWFIPEITKNGWGVIESFIAYQIDLVLNPVASHGQPIFYHPLVLFFGVFPASILALTILFRRKQEPNSELTRWMKALFWVVLIVFSLVTTKIVHYSSLCFFPLTFLAAQGIHKAMLYRKYQLLLGWGVTFLIGVTLSLIPVVFMDETIRMGLAEKVKDAFTRENLMVDGGWWGIEWIFGICFIANNWMLFRVVYKRYEGWIQLNLLVNAVILTGLLAMVVPKVERHIQGPFIDHLTEYQQDTVYFTTYGFKSYAHYYYGRIKPIESGSDLDRFRSELLKQEMGGKAFADLNASERKVYQHAETQFLLQSDSIDYPTVVTCKINKVDELQQILNMDPVFNQGGYAVFYRE
jgi:4-amino-4-deoxy-L-arabinose transferase-like glycosyltransferase